MPPPPPPPPPMGGLAPPPPPPAFGGGGGSKPAGAPNRNALLSDIHKGLKLKKTVTNDRSTPLVSNDQKPSSNGSSAGHGSVSSAKSPSSSAGPQALGGLFSNGIPKLKTTGSKFLPNQPSSSPSPSSQSSGAQPRFSTPTRPALNGSNTISSGRNQDIASTLNKRFAQTSQKPEVPKSKSTWNQGSATVSKASNLSPSSQSSTQRSPSNNKSSPEFEQAKLKLGNIFNPSNNISNNNATKDPTPSPKGHELSNGSSLHRLNNALPSNKYHTIHAPRKSSQSQSQINKDSADMPAHKGQAPQPPSGPGLVKRSNSQSSSSNSNSVTPRPKIQGPKPPSNKPPPPPKQSTLSSGSVNRSNAPAPPPHQSNAGGGSSSGKPPAPPRGASISEELSSHATPNSATSLARQQFFEQIGSPTTPSSNHANNSNTKMGYNHSHSASQTSLNSSRPVRPPVGPPPPPPSRFSSVTNNNNNNSDMQKPLKPAPPIPQQIEQLMEAGGWTDPVPLPPQRISSRSLANRFQFPPIAALPAPDRMLNLPKMYPSQAPKSRKQGAPPVPEQPMNGQANNFLHSVVPNRPSPVSVQQHQDRKFHIQIQRSK